MAGTDRAETTGVTAAAGTVTAGTVTAATATVVVETDATLFRRRGQPAATPQIPIAPPPDDLGLLAIGANQTKEGLDSSRIIITTMLRTIPPLRDCKWGIISHGEII